MRLGRTLPDLDSGLVLQPDDWRAANIPGEKPVPKSSAPLDEVLRVVASLGRFMGRKSGGEHGVTTLWPGLQGVMAFAAYIRYAGEAPLP